MQPHAEPGGSPAADTPGLVRDLSSLDTGMLDLAGGKAANLGELIGFDASKKYPVIVQVYGGPSGPRVASNWHTPEDQILLDAGYILFRLDNRGVGYRSVAFKTAIDRKMGQLEVDDRKG